VENMTTIIIVNSDLVMCDTNQKKEKFNFLMFNQFEKIVFVFDKRLNLK
jgi:hypothetical protein